MRLALPWPHAPGRHNQCDLQRDAQKGLSCPALGQTSREQGLKAALETLGGIVTRAYPPLALCTGDVHCSWERSGSNRPG